MYCKDDKKASSSNTNVHDVQLPSQLIFYSNKFSIKPPISIYDQSRIDQYLAENLLLALNLAPKYQRAYNPTQHPAVRPPNELTPRATPKLLNRGLEKWIAPVAKVDLVRSFPANRLAAYCGYVIGR